MDNDDIKIIKLIATNQLKEIESLASQMSSEGREKYLESMDHYINKLKRDLDREIINKDVVDYNAAKVRWKKYKEKHGTSSVVAEEYIWMIIGLQTYIENKELTDDDICHLIEDAFEASYNIHIEEFESEDDGSSDT